MKVFAFSFIVVLFTACNSHNEKSQKTISGPEDMWGNPIDLDSVIATGKTVMIVPFSSSNCGYCLIDGFFTERNYIEENNRHGGFSYHMCLFNPQLDVYSFQKHFQWHSTILGFPPELHQYHQDGFPTVLAFRNGKQVLREHYNYDKTDTLAGLLWDQTGHMVPTGELHMASRIMFENESFSAIYVYPAGKSVPEGEKRNAEKWKSYYFKTIGELSADDRKQHLFINFGRQTEDLRNFFGDAITPVGFTEDSFVIGNYSFRADSNSLVACFPNPFNPEKYILLKIRDGNSTSQWPNNYLDYLVYSGSDGNAKRLLYGHFQKNRNNIWTYNEQTAFSDIDRKAYCRNRCELPVQNMLRENPAIQISVKKSKVRNNKCLTMGNSSCRFPDMAADEDGNCWITWEEDGNIALARIGKKDKTETWWVENNESDSYHPVVAALGREVRIAYLNHQEGYYRLYSRSFDGRIFTGEILISGKMPADIVTPAIASDHDQEFTFAWSEWMANQRFLKSRRIRSGVLAGIEDIQPAPPVYIDGYTNAWSISLCYTSPGRLTAAWNQHYPANFGVFASVEGGPAVSITREAEKMDDRETGGYPDVFCRRDGSLFAVWESNGWEVLESGKKQHIMMAAYVAAEKKWSMGKPIPINDKTVLNQTPSGVCDHQGNRYVVWSGRDTDPGHSWQVFLTVEKNGNWEEPVMISEEDENARHPKIILSQDQQIWISYHAGRGKEMKVKVVKF